MLDRLFHSKCRSQLEKALEDNKLLLEAVQNYEEASRINEVVISTLKDAVQLNKETIQISQETVELLTLTIESSKTTLRNILGMDSDSGYGIESLTDMAATYIIKLEGQVSGR